MYAARVGLWRQAQRSSRDCGGKGGVAQGIACGDISAALHSHGYGFSRALVPLTTEEQQLQHEPATALQIGNFERVGGGGRKKHWHTSAHLPSLSQALTSAPLRMSKQQHAKCVWLPVVRLLRYDGGQPRLQLHLMRSIVELRQRGWRYQRARQQTLTLAGCKQAHTMTCSRPLQQLQRRQRRQQLRLLEPMQMQILQSR